MLYNRLSDIELERAVYIDPTNQAARDEMIGRLPVLMDTRSDELQDLEMQLESVAKEHKAEVEALEEDLVAEKSYAHGLADELDQARERIDQLTRAEDLV
jgi:hypothetical protein